MLPGRRIAVLGTTGSGKTSLSRRIGAALAIPVIELDAINWQADWRDLNSHDPGQFIAQVMEAIAIPNWVSDGNYSEVRSIILSRATDVVWLDYSKPRVMGRVLRRSLARAIGGREIWPGTGNVERFADWLSPEHPIRWAWSTHARRRRDYGALMQTLPPGVTRHHLRSPRDADALVRSLMKTPPIPADERRPKRS